MTTFTAEEVRELARHTRAAAQSFADGTVRAPEWATLSGIESALTAYADLLEQRAARVTDDVARSVLESYLDASDGNTDPDDNIAAMRTAIEAVWPVAAEQVAQENGRAQRIENALRAILEIGKRNTENPKYDGFYEEARAALAAQPRAVPDVAAMVNRFLGWALPKDFAPDAGISYDPAVNTNQATGEPYPNSPSGTNLFTAAQAEQMFRYVLAAAPQP